MGRKFTTAVSSNTKTDVTADALIAIVDDVGGTPDLAGISPTDLLGELTWFNEAVDDRVDALLADGTGIDTVYDDAGNLLTVTVDLGDFDTDDLGEGLTNLYYTDERVDDRTSSLIQDGTGITWAYDDGAGTLTPTVSLSVFDTGDLSEGSNLYYTEGRVSANASVAANTTHRTSTGADHSYIDQSVISGASPTFVGTNFTGIPAAALGGVLQDLDTLGPATLGGQFIVASAAGVFAYESGAAARASLNVDIAGTDNSTDVTLAGTLDYLTLSGQAITRNAIDLATDITLASMTAGDILYGAGETSLSRLAANALATNRFLRSVSSGNPSWEPLVANDIPDLSATYQPLDGGLVSIAGLTTLADRMIYTTAPDMYAVTGLSAFGRSLIDDANQGAAQATLGVDPAGTDNSTSDITAIPGADHTLGAGSPTITLVAGENLVFGDACYIKSDGKAWKADSDNAAPSEKSIIIAAATITAGASGSFALPLSTLRDDTWAWSVGEPIYLSTTAGALTQTAPDPAIVLGVATHADRMIFFPSLQDVPAGIGDIGIAGNAGFGLGICPPNELPSGMLELPGTRDRMSAQYGNYQYPDGSIMVYVPQFYYKVGTGSNGLSVNVIDVKAAKDYTDRTAAEADGYALHRAFVDGGAVQSGFFVDKYTCSKAAWGAGYIASSIKNGLPISTSSAHNPIADLTACGTNTYFEVIDAAHARDGVDGAVNSSSIFFCSTRFIYSALAILSMAHGQAASSATYCAWYDAGGTTNFPKGCNNNALGDTNDGAISYTSDGYSNSGKTGSGTPFARTTHNGQECGVADLNGLMWEISLGLTRPGTSSTDTTQQNDAADFYVLKESVRARDLSSGWNAGNDAWGDATHLATLYDQTTIAHIANGAGWLRFGNAANQVLSEAISGAGYVLTSLGIYKDANAKSAGGINLFGVDGLYEYHRANLAVISGGLWDSASDAGLWCGTLGDYRSNSSSTVGLRCACYPV